MHRKRRRRERRSQAQWAEILQRFGSSGQGPREFCRREGLSLSSFERWRRRVGPTAVAEFVELVPASRVAATVTSWSLDVALPNGVQLRFRG